jgi:hypothetical protein
MNCKDAEKMISPFLEDDLDNRDLAQFLDHMDTCPECREELTIQFLVLVGMKRLEDGNTFNLKEELDNMLRDARKKLKFRRSLKATSLILEFMVAVMTVATVILAMTT